MPRHIKDYSQFRGRRKYINAVPACDFIDHWPTEEQMAALQQAKRLAIQDRDRQKRKHSHAQGLATVKVRDGSLSYACVHLMADGNFASFIQYENSASPGGICHTKQWSGVPEWAPEEPPAAHHHHHHHHGAHPAMRHRIPGGRVDIHAPPTQTVYVPEEIVVVRQRVIREVHLEDQHIQDNAPTNAQIEMAASQVQVHENHQVIETRIEAKPRGFWASMLFGPAKSRPAAQEQQAPRIAPPQVVDRGALQSVRQPAAAALPAPQHQAAPIPMPGVRALPAPHRPEVPMPAPQRQGQPLAIAHQPAVEMPIEMPRKKSRSWI